MSDERFARQYRYEPPSAFPLTSPCTGIVHHLSGPNRYAHTQTSLRRSKSVVCAKQKNPTCYFHCAYRFATRILAQMLDSLVRVSRRVEKNHLVNVLDKEHFSLGLAISTLGVLKHFHLDFQPPSRSYIAARTVTQALTTPQRSRKHRAHIFERTIYVDN